MLAVMAQIVAATGLGTAGGIVGGLFGIGGGVLVIPIIGMLYGLDQQVAQGTTLVMVVPNVLFAFWRYRQRVGVDLRIAATLGLSALVATYPVARIATGLDPHDLRLSFAGFLALLAAIIAWRTSRGEAGRPPRRPPPAWGWSAGLGLAGGAVSGLFGVGGAFIAPPVLTASLFAARVRGAVQGSGRPPVRHIVADPKGAFHRIDARTTAPARDKGAGEGGIGEMDGDGVVEHAAQPRRGHRPAVGAAIVVEPGLDAVEPGAEPVRRHRDPDAHRKTTFGLADH